MASVRAGLRRERAICVPLSGLACRASGPEAESMRRVPRLVIPDTDPDPFPHSKIGSPPGIQAHRLRDRCAPNWHLFGEDTEIAGRPSACCGEDRTAFNPAPAHRRGLFEI